MQVQPTQDDVVVVGTHPTQGQERAADETLERIAAARLRADSVEDDTAQAAWRDLAHLASRLHRQSRVITHALERQAREL